MGRRLIRTSGASAGSRGTNSPLQSSSSTLEDSGTFDSNEDRETNNYKLVLDAFIVLLQRDRDLLIYVFPAEMQSLVFTKLIELPLVYMRDDAKRLCTTVERLPRKLDAGKFAIYGNFSILRWFLRSRPIFAKFCQVCPPHEVNASLMDVLFQESDETRRQQFTTLSSTFEESVTNTLSAFAT